MNGPLKTITPHPLVSIKADHLGELPQRHVNPITVEVGQIVGGKLVELRTKDRATNGIQCATVLIDWLSLRQERQVCHKATVQDQGAEMTRVALCVALAGVGGRSLAADRPSLLARLTAGGLLRGADIARGCWAKSLRLAPV